MVILHGKMLVHQRGITSFFPWCLLNSQENVLLSTPDDFRLKKSRTWWLTCDWPAQGAVHTEHFACSQLVEIKLHIILDLPGTQGDPRLVDSYKRKRQLYTRFILRWCPTVCLCFVNSIHELLNYRYLCQKKPSEIGVTKQLCYEKLINLIEDFRQVKSWSPKVALNPDADHPHLCDLSRHFFVGEHLFPHFWWQNPHFESEKSSLFRVKLPISKYLPSYHVFLSTKNTNSIWANYYISLTWIKANYWNGFPY